jgi:hypothetical protein
MGGLKRKTDDELKVLRTNIVQQLLKNKREHPPWEEAENNTLEASLEEVLTEMDSRGLN